MTQYGTQTSILPGIGFIDCNVFVSVRNAIQLWVQCLEIRHSELYIRPDPHIISPVTVFLMRYKTPDSACLLWIIPVHLPFRTLTP
jgi:hypothetical protein